MPHGNVGLTHNAEHVLDADENDDDRKYFPDNDMRRRARQLPEETHHGTIVIRKPARAQTLTLVTVLTTISTIPVNARPMRE